MRVSFNFLISVAIFLIFFTGFQGGRYFMANRVQELGLLLSITLFFYGAFVASLNVRDKDLKWNWWFFATIFFVAYTFILPAYVFSQNADVAMLPSVMASREFLIVFFGPAIYFLYRIGYDIRTVEKVFTAALVFLAFNYLFHYFRMDLSAAYNSPNHTVAALVTHDPWRGYRLKPSSFALFTLSILAPFLMITSKEILKKLAWFIIVLILAYIWFLVKARAMAASLIICTMMYPFFFAKKSRLGLLFFALPIMFIGLFTIMTIVTERMAKGGANDAVRLRSYSIAWESIKETPFLGFGQQSNYTKTEQDIFWYKFYSADIGITGVAFKYGFIGVAVYIFFSVFLVMRLVRSIWLYKYAYGRINPVMFSILVVLLTQLLNIILNTTLIFIQGLTLASFTIGITAVWRHKILKEFPALAKRSRKTSVSGSQLAESPG
jgi:hypothetical protein